jgi:hypothetical protein
MKKIIISSVLLVATSLTSSAQFADRTGLLTTIAGFDFNSGGPGNVTQLLGRYNQQFDTYFVTTPNASYGLVSFTSAGGIGATFASARALSTTSQSPVYDLLSTSGLTVSNNSLGDINNTTIRTPILSNNTTLDTARAVFQISTLNPVNGFEDINVAYSARNGGTGANGIISWSYSFDGIAFTPITGSSNTITPSASAYNVFTSDFSAVTAIESVSTLYLGLEYTESGAAATTFIDNIAFYGTGVAAIPEPSTFAALAGLAGLAIAGTRRRRSVRA